MPSFRTWQWVFPYIQVTVHHRSNIILVTCLSKNFAPVFIMLRVAQGRARPDTSEWSGKISRLEFSSNPGGRVETQVSAGRSRSHYGTSGGLGTNTILTVSRSHLEHEIDLEAGTVSDMDPVTGKENLDATLWMKEEAGVRENVVSTR
jgi:hypothetical protein